VFVNSVCDDSSYGFLFVSKCLPMIVSNLLPALATSFCYANVCSVALHPEKQVLATASDDRSWKLWSIPEGELILTGHGHSDWVSGCDFHPSYVLLLACQIFYLISSSIF